MTAASKYDGSRVHLSLAGSGDPWSALTKLRKRILRELHDQPDSTILADMLGMKPTELIAEIRPMMDASLVYEMNGLYHPSFLVTNEIETQTVYNHACTFSKNLADTIQADFDEIRDAYHELTISTSYDFDETALFLVGGRILDIKLLEKLSIGNRIMTPAPSRPSPARPDARYYFFMVEGDPLQLGGFGQDDSTMPWPSWHYITFGQNLIDGKANLDRKKMDMRYEEIISSGSTATPEEVGSNLGIPIMGPKDSTYWENTSEKYAERLCKCYEEHEASIKSLHGGLRAGTYAPHSEGEFFCWYAHIAYAHAIELLEERGFLHIPPTRFQAMILHRGREDEGMLIDG